MAQTFQSTCTKNERRVLAVDGDSQGVTLEHSLKDLGGVEKDEGDKDDDWFCNSLGWLASYITFWFPSTPPEGHGLTWACAGVDPALKNHVASHPAQNQVQHGTLADQTPTLSNHISNIPSPTPLAQQKTSLRSEIPFAASEKTLVEAADASLPNNVDTIIFIQDVLSTNRGVCINGVLVLTHVNTLRFLETVHFSALIERERIVKQVQRIMDHAYDQAVRMQEDGTHSSLPIYQDRLDENLLSPSEIQQLEDEKELSLEQCWPVMKAHALLLRDST